MARLGHSLREEGDEGGILCVCREGGPEGGVAFGK